jgi:hypothetical protein
LGLQDLGLVGTSIGTGLGFEMIAEVSSTFIALLFGCRFPAMFGVRNVVLHTHLANMKLRIALLASVEPTQGKA